MAINEGNIQQTTDGDDELSIKFNNGDLKALNEIQDKWKFKDKASLFKFVMAVLLRAEGNKIKISVSGNETEVLPKEDLLKNKESQYGQEG